MFYYNPAHATPFCTLMAFQRLKLVASEHYYATAYSYDV